MSNEAGIRTVNAPTGTVVAEFLGHQDDGGVRSLRRFARSTVLGAIEGQLASLAASIPDPSEFNGNLLVYSSVASLNADLAHDPNTMAYVVGDAGGENTDGIYQKSGASGSGSWTRIGPIGRQIVGSEYNVLTSAVYERAFRGVTPKFKSGDALPYANAISSTFNGWAVPFQWSGTAFDMVRIGGYLAEDTSRPLRVVIWNAAGTAMIASGIAKMTSLEGSLWVQLDQRVSVDNASAGPLYLAVQVYGPGSHRLSMHKVIGYTDISDPSTYPQRYHLTSGSLNDPLNTGWAAVSGNVGSPIAFALYDTLSLTNLGPSIVSPDALNLSPRLYGVVGTEMSVYYQALRIGQGPRQWEVNGNDAYGKQQDERWTYTPASSSDVSLTFQCYDPDTNELVGSTTPAVSIVANDAAAAAGMSFCMIGDSTTEAASLGIPTQRILDRCAQFPSGVQVTLVGTRGPGSGNVHEGRSGWTASNLLSSKSVAGVDNAFIQTDGQKFDASYYLSSTGFSAPDVVGWHFGINDAFAATTDNGASQTILSYLAQMDLMIGLTSDAAVGSWMEASPSTKHFVCVPIMPNQSEDAFGDDYGLRQSRRRYRRNIMLLQKAVVAHFSGLEDDGIFLIPYHAVVDTVNGFPRSTDAPASTSVAAASTYLTYSAMMADLTPADGALVYVTDAAHYFVKVGPTTVGTWRLATSDDGILRRPTSGVHPKSGVGAYTQMGDVLWQALNVVKVKGW
ncbi:hypothetical protein [Mesorhizobium sp.]|uniref:hypothetical protein n=1 Tax=Mesorhizobium sp. TaxID=1871066 RepID=UPI0025E9FC33|nr:hypothetical protein [Mesorhizobium sp.]